jgi:hypothetical protein
MRKDPIRKGENTIIELYLAGKSKTSQPTVKVY